MFTASQYSLLFEFISLSFPKAYSGLSPSEKNIRTLQDFSGRDLNALFTPTKGRFIKVPIFLSFVNSFFTVSIIKFCELLSNKVNDRYGLTPFCQLLWFSLPNPAIETFIPPPLFINSSEVFVIFLTNASIAVTLFG